MCHGLMPRDLRLEGFRSSSTMATIPRVRPYHRGNVRRRTVPGYAGTRLFVLQPLKARPPVSRPATSAAGVKDHRRFEQFDRTPSLQNDSHKTLGGDRKDG